MTVEMATIVSKTVVELGNAAILLYGIKAMGAFLAHWLDSFPRRDARTPQQQLQDEQAQP